jgi:hypothetical protein
MVSKDFEGGSSGLLNLPKHKITHSSCIQVHLVLKGVDPVMILRLRQTTKPCHNDQNEAKTRNVYLPNRSTEHYHYINQMNSKYSEHMSPQIPSYLYKDPCLGLVEIQSNR